MTYVIKEYTANLDVKSDGNRPVCKVNVNDGTFFFFLRDDPDPATSRQAIVIVGTVLANKAQTDALAGLDIGFIQYVKESKALYQFAGSNSSNGSLVMNFAQRPDTYQLDGMGGAAPFQNNSSPSELPAWIPPMPPQVVIRATADDHPFNKMAVSFTNFLTNKDNYLIRAQKSIDLCTAFVVRDKSRAGPFNILAYVNWHAAYDFVFTHHTMTNGPPVITAQVVSFGADPFAKGAPTDQKLAGQIKNASSGEEIYNDTAIAQGRLVADATANSSLIQCYRHWDAGINAAPRFVP